MNKKALLVFVLLGAGFAFATATAGPFSGIDSLPRWMKVGFYVGSAATQDTSHRITKSAAGRRDWDFGAIGAGLVNCEDAAAVTVTTGTASVGDPCMVADNFGQDGGAGLPLGVLIGCKVTGPNSVTVRACSMQADAGTTNMLDGGFFFRTFSNQ